MMNPYIKTKITVTRIMLDVLLALLPMAVVACLAYGYTALWMMLTAMGSALLSEIIGSFLLPGKWKPSFLDGSALVTALLLCFTLSPKTPLLVVAFGAAMAILFGKLLWGGLGGNQFNPALVGREFMAAFFPAVMSGATLWATKSLVNIPGLKGFSFFGSEAFSHFSDGLIYKTGGALGEYSILAIALGGLFLLVRQRISWHIPFALLVTFAAGVWILQDTGALRYSVGGVLLSAVFMATDMPSSPNNRMGQIYYGVMIGIVTLLFLKTGIRYEYMSYSILILNGYALKITTLFQPRAWGVVEEGKRWNKLENLFLLTLRILSTALAVSALHYYGFTQWLVFVFVVYLVLKFRYSYSKATYLTD
ncbi:MAG: RnfABCDGE type electron transport complex subunit D [Bacteroides sp.]|nr:RnfABCDGE type electron transport complex subunit D [Bacteroides sp.]